MIKEFIQLIYPDFCSGCKHQLLFSEKSICSSCLSEFRMSSKINNHRYYGRKLINKEIYASNFFKNKLLQKMIHEIKYNGNKGTAYVLGIELGYLIKDSCNYKEFDFIIPVPTSEIKKLKRGYNQSELIANGVSKIIKKPILINHLLRENNLRSQINSDKYKRWKNVDQQYKLAKPLIENSNILLIDDVVTTGATINSCVEAILSKTKKIKITVGALAGNK